MQVLSDTEQVILDVFRTHGPLLSRTALEEHCVKRGIKRHYDGPLYAGRLAIMARYAQGFTVFEVLSFHRTILPERPFGESVDILSTDGQRRLNHGQRLSLQLQRIVKRHCSASGQFSPTSERALCP
jgi:hypothetical protein